MNDTKYKILLIEDDKLDQMAFKRMMKDRELPYDCTVAGSVSQAQSILACQEFDVVISDYSLGDGTAFDILDLVKSIPVILVTGAGNEELATKAWKAGAYDYLIKDLDQNHLKTVSITIENAIRHKKIEEILNQKKKNLEAIFDAAPVGMLLVDENMIVRRVNDAIRQMVHKDYLEIINRRLGGALSCIHSTSNDEECGYSPSCAECPLPKTIKNVLDSEQPVHGFEIQPTLKVDNKEITPWLCIRAEPVMIDDCMHVVIAVNDISERKEAEEKLKETMEMKSQFISTVSHELRTPLTCIKNAITNIVDGAVGRINRRQRDFLDIAKRNVDRLAELINDVLDFQKLQSGKIKLDIQENDITGVVKEAYETMLLSAKSKGIDFSLELESNLPRAKFDHDEIIRVLINLIGNAIKFTPEQGRVSVGVQQQNEELLMRVSDTGIGIPKKDLLKIFDRFYRVHRPGKQIQGTGLGLAIVNKIMMMHGGRIEVESEQEKGATFTVFLPLAAKATPEVFTETDEILENAVAGD